MARNALLAYTLFEQSTGHCLGLECITERRVRPDMKRYPTVTKLVHYKDYLGHSSGSLCTLPTAWGKCTTSE